MSEQERVLFVHAHPDDETLVSGGTIATLVDQGALVTVVTCTRGERGEVIPPELRHLSGAPGELAAHREGELRDALAILGVTDHRYLGSAGARWRGRAERRYVDSGMVWGADGAEPLPDLDTDCLAAADLGEVASDIAVVITDMRPHIVVSYDDFGGYGHPDHIRAARAARRAADVYGVPFYAIDSSRPAAIDTSEPAAIDTSRPAATSAGPAAATSADLVVVDIRPVLDRKRRALAAHRTQVVIARSGNEFALSNGVVQPLDGVERFRRVHREYPQPTALFADQPFGLKVVGAVVGLLVGLAAGAILTVAHQAAVTVAAVTLPLGLAAGILVVAALLAGLRLVFGTRVVAGFAALGIVSVIGILSLRSAGGSVLVPQSLAGVVWAIAPTVIAIVVLGWPRLPSRPMGGRQPPSRPRDTMGTSPEVKGSLPQ